MTTQRRLRSILSLTATVVLIALAAPGIALEEQQFRLQVEQFLADEARGQQLPVVGAREPALAARR